MKKTICAAAWSHLMIETDGTYKSCWAALTDNLPFEKSRISDMRPEDWWNSAYLKDLRKIFLQGQTPLQCKQCFELEKNELKSDRTENFLMEEKELEERLLATDRDGHFDESSIQSLELQLTNLCNFACRTCGPHNSTSWAKDYVFLSGKNARETYIRPFSDSAQLSKSLSSTLKTAKRVFFIGGEPLIQPEHYHILDELSAHQNFDCEINYTTNLSRLGLGKLNVLDYWKKFRSIKLTVSLDGLAHKGEYIREGFKWSEFEKNLKLIQESSIDLELRCNITVSLLNILDINEIISYCLRKGIEPRNIKIGPVKAPLSYSITLLPQESKTKIAEKIRQGSRDHEYLHDDIEGLINYMNSHDHHQFKHYFYHLNGRLDILRGQSLTTITPIMEYF